MMQIAFSRFKDFLKEQYPLYECNIKPEFITKDMMVLFVDYLQSRSVGEGAKSIYQRFKKVIRYTIEHDVILKDPCKESNLQGRRPNVTERCAFTGKNSGSYQLPL